MLLILSWFGNGDETRTVLEEFTHQDTGASLVDIASSDNSVISSRDVMTLQ